jgi:hypothetical protein
MRRLIISSVLALVAFAALASGASAATHTPVITSFSPSQVAVGQKLVLNGKYFKTGITHNRVFFVRASDGKTVRARPSKASSTRRMEVIVPATITQFLNIVNGKRSATRFEIYVLSGLFSKTTPKSKSPIILPAGTSAPGTPGGTTVTPPPPADCDADGTPDAQDTDDDNDGLPDTLEAQIGTNPCKADTDGDGVSDGFEYYSALDLNNSNRPYPGKRPYPNPLDGSDANQDFDGDGLSQLQEYNLWVTFGGKALPAGPGQSFPYSDGNQFSPAANCPDPTTGCPGAMDLNVDGSISDDEKDADGDGLPNWVELAKGDATVPPTSGIQKANTPCTFTGADNRFTVCTLPSNTTVEVPNGNTFKPLGKTAIGTPPPGFWMPLDMLSNDSDGDTVPDAADDQDHDGYTNLQEITATDDPPYAGNYTNPVDPCDPNPHSPACPQHS